MTFELIEVISAQHSLGGIDMVVVASIDGVEMTIPFGYRPGDPHGLGPAVEQWWKENPNFPVSPERTATADEVRYQRNALLTESDWTQVPDAKVDREAWAAYRQALRDIPQQEGFPAAVIWPTRPDAAGG